MTTKITAIIDNPASPDDFEADPSVLVTRARPEAGDFFQRAFEMAAGGAGALFADGEES